MNGRHYTIMTLDDHHAAAREWSVAHRSVADFEAITRFGMRLPGEVRADLNRIRMDLDKIRGGMHTMQSRSLPGHMEADPCWQEITLMGTSGSARRAPTALTLDQHIAAARALGTAKFAVLRFLAAVSDRRHLPVRILDLGLRVEHRIHAVRCAMSDVQYATRRAPDRLVDCWLGHFNYFDGDLGIPQVEVGSRTTLEAK